MNMVMSVAACLPSRWAIISAFLSLVRELILDSSPKSVPTEPLLVHLYQEVSLDARGRSKRVCKPVCQPSIPSHQKRWSLGLNSLVIQSWLTNQKSIILQQLESCNVPHHSPTLLWLHWFCHNLFWCFWIRQSEEQSFPFVGKVSRGLQGIRLTLSA